MRSLHQGGYSRTQVARTIRLRSYDVDRSYDTTYSQSLSQVLVVSYVRYDCGSTTWIVATIQPIHRTCRKFLSYRTYDTTAIVRRGSQLRYDLFTELVASSCRIVRTIRLRSYDVDRSYDTTYSQRLSQVLVVSYVRYDRSVSVKFVASPLFMFYGETEICF